MVSRGSVGNLYTTDQDNVKFSIRIEVYWKIGDPQLIARAPDFPLKTSLLGSDRPSAPASLESFLGNCRAPQFNTRVA